MNPFTSSSGGVAKTINLPEVQISASRSSQSGYTPLPAVISSFLGLVNNIANREHVDYWNRVNQENFERSLQFNSSEAEKTRQFNSVQSLVNQYKAAGLNPNLLAGQIGGSSASAEATGQPDFSSFFSENPAAGLQEAFKMVSDMNNSQKLADANVDLMHSQAELNRAEAEESGRRDAEYYNSQSEERKRQIRLMDDNSLVFRTLARDQFYASELKRIAKSTEDEFRRAVIAYNRSQARANNAAAQIDEFQYGILNQVRQYIIQGYTFEYDEHEITYKGPDGKIVTQKLRPKDNELIGAVLDNMQITTEIAGEQQRQWWLPADKISGFLIDEINATANVVNSASNLVGAVKSPIYFGANGPVTETHRTETKSGNKKVVHTVSRKRKAYN